MTTYPASYYQNEIFLSSYLKDEPHNKKSISFSSSDIHCASCAIRIEKHVRSNYKNVSCRVNITNKTVTIYFEKGYSVSKIIDSLDSEGFKLSPIGISAEVIDASDSSKSLLYRIAFAAFAAMNLMWISIALYNGVEDKDTKDFFSLLSLIIATPTLLYSGFPFLRNGYYSIKSMNLGMDVPIAIGSVVTYSYSFYSYYTDTGEIYFDTVVNFIFVILLGRYFEAEGRRKAVFSANTLSHSRPILASVLGDDGKIEIKSVTDLKKGEKVKVNPGELIATDGVVISGSADVSESLITGESMYIVKKVGSKVLSGTLNINGSIVIEVEKESSDTLINEIVDLTMSASSEKSRYVKIADKIIPYFIFSTLSISTLTFLYWYSDGIEIALLASVSVLIITCPCALGLATPLAISIASGSSSKNQILIKDGGSLEKLYRGDVFVFDKTGTLTMGVLKVEQIKTTIEEHDFLGMILLIEQSSSHPIATAIKKYCFEKNIVAPEKTVEGFEVKPGQGISLKIDEDVYELGNYLDNSEQMDSQKTTNITLSKNGVNLGTVTLRDEIKIDAKQTIDELKKQNKQVIMLSGDSKGSVEFVAKEIGIDNYHYRQSPQDKYREIEKLKENNQIVVMVGDGINDSPALALADISIAMGLGSDLASSSSDIIILGMKINPIVSALKISKETTKVIKQNIYFALGYNLVMIPLAVMATVTPLVAAIIMPISSLIVVANSSRIKNININN
jgi:Cu2+-exporting ATPase